MRTIKFSKPREAFTLIELLIVVAIIAILAAIAVPNFLEAQTRSKVSRLLADMRTMKTGLESYRVDHNDYPETDLGQTVFNGAGRGMYRLTTPISYLTSVPLSPFSEENIGHPAATPQNAVKEGFPLYVRAKPFASNALPAGVSGNPDSDNDGVDDNYFLDRLVYLKGKSSATGSGDLATGRAGFYELKSVGPDNIDDRDSNQPSVWNPGSNTDGGFARVYDPTNGTVSAGDIVTFQDTQIPADMRP